MNKLMILSSLTVASFYCAQGTSAKRCYDLDSVLKVEPTDLYKPHLSASKKFKVDILENSDSVDKYINKGKFVTVKKKSRGYRLDNLQHSRPYIVKKGRTILEKMANDFANLTKSYFTVSSVTRTLEDQCRLRKVNKNASLGISSHNYGNSFDISYVRFDGVLKYNSTLEKDLGNLLEDYKKKGYIYYIKEKHQSCYHVTVRNY